MRVRRTAIGALVAATTGLMLAACGGAASDGASESDGQAAEATPAAETEASGQDAWPDGWMSRTDDGDTTRAAVQLTAVDGGVRVRPGPRALYWRRGDAASGSYRVGATFTQMERAPAPEAYGLFLGGQDLTGAGQDYLYFLVRQTGEYLVKHRAGAETHELVGWSTHPAVRAFSEGADSLANELAVDAGEGHVVFLVNGTAVDSLERGEQVNTDGVYGARVNHRLDVRITGLERREQRP